MEDADSDSGFDSDGDWYHAGRDIVHGLRTNSHAVGPTEHTEDGSCVKKRKREAPVGMPLFSVAKCRNRLSTGGTACLAPCDRHLQTDTG